MRSGDRSLYSNPYLKARGESQLRAKHAFEQAAGWRYGLVFGGLVVFFAYGWDALQQNQLHAEFWWLRLALALLTILPLALFVGGIAGYFNWVIKVLLWVVFGFLAAYLTIHIPFDGARLVLGRLDPNLNVQEYLPLTAQAANTFAILALVSGALGILVGLGQVLLVNWAWENSSEDYHLTLTGWLLFLLVTPLALGYAFLLDVSGNNPLRAPLVVLDAVVQSGLNDPQSQDQTKMTSQQSQIYAAGQRLRTTLTPDYTLRVAAPENPATGDAYVDVSFDSGANLRCIVSGGEFPRTCYDMNAEFSRILTEFVPRGSFRCPDCEMQVSDAAAEWQREHASALDPADIFTLRHGAGDAVVVRVRAVNGAHWECVFAGVNPLTIQNCTTEN